MELRMERDGQRMTLRLKKNENVQYDVPVYTSKDNVIRKVDTTAMPVSTIQIILIHLQRKLFPLFIIRSQNYRKALFRVKGV